MTTLRERVPPALRMPMGISSLAVGIVGVGIGYILGLMGLVLFFNLHPIAENGVSTFEAISVTLIGIAVLAVGIAGWRAFMYFAY